MILFTGNDKANNYVMICFSMWNNILTWQMLHIFKHHRQKVYKNKNIYLRSSTNMGEKSKYREKSISVMYGILSDKLLTYVRVLL